MLGCSLNFTQMKSSSYTLATLQVRFLLRVLHSVEVYVVYKKKNNGVMGSNVNIL